MTNDLEETSTEAPDSVAETVAADAQDPDTARASKTPPDQSAEASTTPRAEKTDDEEAKIRDARRRGQESPRAVLLECFSSAFHNEEALRTYCFEHFDDVHKLLKETDRFFGILRELISYCESRDRVPQLWDWLASESKPKYDEWFPRWSEACKKNRDSREAEYAEFRAAASPARQNVGQTSTEHPLSSDNAENVSDWFFNDLNPLERGNVLATALFQEMNRTYLVGVARDFEKLLDPASDQTSDDRSSPE
ncbi:MAG TPA: hypothetical protein DDY14_09465 [Chromatiaceae bacterium]|jgi:hypothetical protein|nr:MAG: hypothetical protein N838_08795 [Thiohalocapsa sp. PB-PSB1]QQO56182.1 MAG: hypothetical protein N838_25310 [Thiohalocapsa sp. PB-PSB1]HBG95531.1 hypothetical protein [Chromatiaceae bacterium]HCS88998.1 hypothetical protein [Chromatiaceae bacterium]